MPTWTIQCDADPSLSGSANSDLNGNCTLDESNKPSDFDSNATVNSVRFHFQLTGTGFVDDTWDVTNGTIHLHDSVNGATAQCDPAADTGNGNETATVDLTDNSPAATSGASYQNALTLSNPAGSGALWALYNVNKMSDGGTIDLQGGALETFVVIDYTPAGGGGIVRRPLRSTVQAALVR